MPLTGQNITAVRREQAPAKNNPVWFQRVFPRYCGSYFKYRMSWIIVCVLERACWFRCRVSEWAAGCCSRCCSFTSVCALERACWCRCRVLPRSATSGCCCWSGVCALEVACAAAGCRCRVLLQGAVEWSVCFGAGVLGAVVGCGFRVLLLEWCVRFGAGMLAPLQDAAGCCQSAVCAGATGAAAKCGCWRRCTGAARCLWQCGLWALMEVTF